LRVVVDVSGAFVAAQVTHGGHGQDGFAASAPAASSASGAGRHLPTVLALLERVVDTGSVARAYVELPDGWGDSRVIRVAWERAGYRVQEQRTFGNGPNRLIVSGHDGGPRGGGPLDRSSRLHY